MDMDADGVLDGSYSSDSSEDEDMEEDSHFESIIAEKRGIIA